MKKIVSIFFGGMAMGSADVVPGVSGGTIAFILGFYPRLLGAIAAFNLDFVKLLLRFRIKEALALIPWDFLLPLLSGILLAIFSLARLVIYLMNTWPVMLWSFFFGLILASVVMLGREMDLKNMGAWLAFALGTACGWLVAGADAVNLGQSLPIYFASGFIAICAMILPGISGSFILVLLGQYRHVINAVATLDFPILLSFALGCVLGITSFARVVSWLLKHFPNFTLAFFTGLMAGGLRTVWPWHENNFPGLPPVLDSSIALALACCLVGMLLPLAMQALANSHSSAITNA